MCVAAATVLHLPKVQAHCASPYYYAHRGASSHNLTQTSLLHLVYAIPDWHLGALLTSNGDSNNRPGLCRRLYVVLNIGGTGFHYSGAWDHPASPADPNLTAEEQARHDEAKQERKRRRLEDIHEEGGYSSDSV